MSGAAFSSPAKQYKEDRKGIVLNDFDTEAYWRIVHDFYHDKQYPMLDSILEAAWMKGLFNGERNYVEC